MSKEVRVLSIIVTVSFLLGTAGTTLSIVNNHLIRTRIIKPAKFLLMQKSWRRPGIPQLRQWGFPQGRVSKKGFQKPGDTFPRGELRERLQSLAKEKAKKEKQLMQILGKLNRQLKEQQEAIENLSQKVENLQDKIEELE